VSEEKKLNLIYIDEKKDSQNAFHENFSKNFDIHLFSNLANVIIHLTYNKIDIVCVNLNSDPKKIIKFVQSIYELSPPTKILFFLNKSEAEKSFKILSSVSFFRVILMPQKITDIKKILLEAENVIQFEKSEKTAFAQKLTDLDTLEEDVFTVAHLFFEQLKYHNNTLYNHSKRVAKFATAIATELRLEDDLADKIRLAAYFHDYHLSHKLKDSEKEFINFYEGTERQYSDHALVVSNWFKNTHHFQIVSKMIKFHHIEEFPKKIREHLDISTQVLAIADNIDIEFLIERDLKTALGKAIFKLRQYFSADFLERVKKAILRLENKTRIKHDILASKLEKSMIIAETVFVNEDILLFSRGHRLTPEDIERMQVLLEYCEFPSRISVYE
jgi:HD superfamily phosphodiesterase